MKRIYRSRRERVIGGVCGGLAEHLRTDVSIIRLAWALFSLMGGAGILLYILAWIIVPEEAPAHRGSDSGQERPRAEQAEAPSEARQEPAAPVQENTAHTEAADEDQRLRWFGVILIVFGAYFLMERLVPVRISLWPLLLILIGLVLLVSAGRGGTNGGSLPREPDRSRPVGRASDDDSGQQQTAEAGGCEREEDPGDEKEKEYSEQEVDDDESEQR